MKRIRKISFIVLISLLVGCSTSAKRDENTDFIATPEVTSGTTTPAPEVTTPVTTTPLVTTTTVASTPKPQEQGEMIEVDAQEAYKMILNKDSFLLYIGQTTCSHCADYKPMIEEFTMTYGQDVYYVMLDTSDQTSRDMLAEALGIEYTPSTFYIKEGVNAGSYVGTMESSVLNEFFIRYSR